MVIILSFFNFLNGEIIRVSKLKKKGPVFDVKRNIFFPNKSKVEKVYQKLQYKSKVQVKKEEVKKTLENEIQNGVFFEGYVFKKNQIYALLSVNGEFYIVRNGDIVLEKINIIKIDKSMVLIEVDSMNFNISLKGVNNEEK
jgi:hypothetical protein